MQKVKETLAHRFGKNPIVVSEKVLKINVSSINNTDFEIISGIWLDTEIEKIDLKRSGTGITVLLTFK